MSGALGERRRRLALSLAIAAAALTGVAFITVSIDVRSAQPQTAQGLVLPGLAQQLPRATRITVTSADGAYRIEKAEQGWVMRDRGDYPVNAGRLAQLTDALQELAYVRPMTSDPARFGRLGVGDPRQGGSGILLQMEDAQGALLVNLVFGVEPGGLYVRKPDEQQVWAARAELPPFREPAAWLDLKPLAIDAAQLSRIDVAPMQGNSYSLMRADAMAPDFAIVLPARMEPSTTAAVNAAAQRILNLEPVDVQPATMIAGEPRARITAHMFSGVAIDGTLVESDGKIWLKLAARAERPEAQPAADALNTGSTAWAYALNGAEAEALVAPLATLLPPEPAPAPAEQPPQAPPQQQP
jgi:hypothetical protein